MVFESLIFWFHTSLIFAASLVLGKLLGDVLIRIAGMLVGRTKTTLDDRIFSAIRKPVESFFFLIVFYLLIHELPGYISWLSDVSAAAAFLENYTWAFLVLIGTYLLSEATGATIRWYYEEGHRTSRIKVDLTLLPFLRKASKLVIYFVGITIALSAAGFDIAGLIAVSSVAGIILGLASQETLANIFAGMALQLDRPFRYGDMLRFTTGEVAVLKKIGLRSSMLDDMAGNTIMISNSELAKQRITNFSHPNGTIHSSFPAEVPHGTDTKKLAAHLTHSLPSAHLSGYKEAAAVSVNIERIKGNALELSITYPVEGFSNAAPIRFYLNEKILEFLSGKKKK